MITKILSFFIILWVWYGATVFLAPDISSRIDSALWLSGLSETLRWTKDQVDYVSTDGVNSVLDNAIRVRDDARWVVDSTKDRIDAVREQATRVEETVWEVQGTIENIRDAYESTTRSIDEISWSLRWTSSGTQTSTGSEN